MKLGTTDISTLAVRNITGNPTTDLGTLCVASNDGDGYAFNIVENGYTKGNGYLKVDNLGFPAKFPYYNMYSTNCCGEWVEDAGGVVKYRIKRESASSSNYRYSLGSFGGYDSDAKPPSVPSVTASFVQNTTVQNYPVNIKRIDLGSYDWSKLGAKYAKLVMFYDSNLSRVEYETEYFAISETSPIATLYLTISTTGVYTLDYPMGIMIADAGKSDIGLLPTLGTFSISIVGQTTVRIYADITGSNGISTKLNGTAVTGVYGQNTVTNSVKITAAAKQPKNYELTSVRIVCLDQNGNEVYNQTRQPDYRDYPSSYSDLYEIGVGSSMNMTAYIPTEAWNTISSTGCSVAVTLILN